MEISQHHHNHLNLMIMYYAIYGAQKFSALGPIFNQGSFPQRLGKDHIMISYRHGKGMTFCDQLWEFYWSLLKFSAPDSSEINVAIVKIVAKMKVLENSEVVMEYFHGRSRSSFGKIVFANSVEIPNLYIFILISF